jgi:hypothetical protein
MPQVDTQGATASPWSSNLVNKQPAPNQHKQATVKHGLIFAAANSGACCGRQVSFQVINLCSPE